MAELYKNSLMKISDEQKLKYNPRRIKFLGYIAIVMALSIFLFYNYNYFQTGKLDEPSQILSAVILALLGLIAVGVSKCLENLETKLSLQNRFNSNNKT
jgi:hypothetical protein